MKRLLLTFLAAASVTFSFAQETNESSEMTYVASNATITQFHNEVELEKLGKLELTELYLERVAVMTELVPYLALSKEPSGATLRELGIPETKSNVKHLEEEVKNKEAYLNAVKETLHDIIPYADKENIIWCILFLEEMYHKIEKSAK